MFVPDQAPNLQAHLARRAYWTRATAVVALLHAILPDALPGVNLHKTVATVCRVYGSAQALLGGIRGQRFKVGWPPQVLSEPAGRNLQTLRPAGHADTRARMW